MSEGSGFGRGLNFLMQQRAKSSAGGGDWIPKLFISKDGAVAKFRFLVDESEVFTHNFHEVDVTARSGRTFAKDVVCQRKITLREGEDDVTFIDGPEACEYCNRQEPLPTWWKAVTWVYVYGIFYPEKVNDRCVPATRGSGAHEVAGFLESVNAAWFMPLKGIVAEQVSGMAGMYGTLLDRDYELRRNGKGGSQFYSLYGLDPSEPSDLVRAAIESLPDLTEEVLKEFSIQKKATASEPAGTTTQPPPPDGEASPPASVGDEGPRAPAPKDDDVVRF